MCGPKEVTGFQVSTSVLPVGGAIAVDSDFPPESSLNCEGNNKAGRFQGLKPCKISSP